MINDFVQQIFISFMFTFQSIFQNFVEILR